MSKVIKLIFFSLIITVLLCGGAARFDVFAQAQEISLAPKFAVSKEDDAFLEDLSRRSFLYLWEQTDPKTGLTLDRTRTDSVGLALRPGGTAE